MANNGKFQPRNVPPADPISEVGKDIETSTEVSASEPTPTAPEAPLEVEATPMAPEPAPMQGVPLTEPAIGGGGAGTYNNMADAMMNQLQPGGGVVPIVGPSRPARPAPIMGTVNMAPETPVRIRLMKDLDGVVIGKCDFFREYGVFKAGRDVTVAKYVADSLYEKGYALIY